MTECRAQECKMRGDASLQMKVTAAKTAVIICVYEVQVDSEIWAKPRNAGLKHANMRMRAIEYRDYMSYGTGDSMNMSSRNPVTMQVT
eukprot:3086415-Pleurochrysis_carterae.AAC.4